MKLWSRRPISQRIILVFVTIVVSTASLTAVTIFGIIGIAGANRAIVKGQEWRLYLAEFDANIRESYSKADYLKRIVNKSPEDLTVADDMAIKIMGDRIKDGAEKVRPIIKEMASQHLNDFDETRNKALENIAQWESVRDYPTLVEIRVALEKFKFLSEELQDKLLAQIDKDLKAAHARITRTAVLIIGFGLLIMAILFIMISPVASELRGVFAPMRKASETALMGATNALSSAAEIDGLIAQLRNAMDEVSRATQEVATAAQESSAQLGEIMNAVKNTTDSTGRLSEEAATIYDSLAAHQSLLEERVAQIRQTATDVQSLLRGIAQNADIAEGLTTQVTALREQLAGIETFLAAMNDITDQTELLALNASIEAARAGEHGVGFIVVADRLRRLSDQTKGFTAQIETTVAKLQESTGRVASALTGIIGNVRESVSQVAEITREFSTLQGLLASLQGAHGRIIAAASAQMDKSKEIYRSAMEIMRSVESISAQTEEVSAAMEELSAESQTMIGRIQHISRNVGETRAVVEHQVELARMAKEAADRF